MQPARRSSPLPPRGAHHPTRLGVEAGAFENIADFRLEHFRHRAIWDADAGRIEMQLLSARDQTVHIDEHRFDFSAGEVLRTEYSHKYSLAQFAGLAAAAGLAVRQVWSDRDRLFSVQYLSPARGLQPPPGPPPR